MNWGKMKNVIIIFLVVVNLVLLGVFYGVETANTTLSKEELRHAVKVLENHGISIDANIIPTKSDTMGSLPMIASVQNQERFVSTFLGTNYDHQKEQETGTNVYTAEEKTIRLNGGYVKFYSGREAGEVPSEDDWKNVRVTLEKSGISLKNAAEVRQSPYEVHYRQQYKGKEFFEGTLTVTADSEGIVSIEGFWMVPGGSVVAQEKVGMVTEVFSEFIKDPARLPESNQITEIELGYSVLLGGTAINFSEATAIPVWRFTTADGKTYFYDARRQ